MNTLEAHGHFINAGPDDELMQIEPQWHVKTRSWQGEPAVD